MIKVKVTITSTYKDEKTANAVAKALNTDNVQEERFKITTQSKGKQVTTKIEGKQVSTVHATLEDLLKNQVMAEQTLR